MQLGTGELTPNRKQRTYHPEGSSRPFVLHGSEYKPKQEVAMSPDDAKYLSAQVLELREALTMLYDLLEAYAPMWYSEEHRNKAEAALRSAKSDGFSK